MRKNTHFGYSTFRWREKKDAKREEKQTNKQLKKYNQKNESSL